MLTIKRMKNGMDTDVDFVDKLENAVNRNHSGDFSSEKLMAMMYDVLRRLASSKMTRESGFQTLQPTALVHEAWLRVSPRKEDWNSHAHFFGAVAEAMRRVMVDRARARNAKKRSMPEDEPWSGMEENQDHVLAIHEGLKLLEAENKAAAEIVVLKFFSGFTTEEIAAIRSSNVRAIERQWTYAKARLFQSVRNGNEMRE